MAGITSTSALRVATTVLPVLIIMSASGSMGAVPRKVPCSVPPPDLENGKYAGSQEDRVAIYECNDQFWLKGPPQLRCVTSPDGNDTWVPYPENFVKEDLYSPECHHFEDCEEPEIFQGSYFGECCAPGDEVEFYCDFDRYALSGVENATCLPNGSWSAPLPVCQDTFCKDPGRIPNGQRMIILDKKLYSKECCPPGVAVYHVCDDGYEIVGEQIIHCRANGSWNNARPKCKPEGACDDFEVTHGRLTGLRSGGEFFATGDSAFVECDPGFRVNGSDQLFCQDHGIWDKMVPTCAEYNCTRFTPLPQLIVEEFEKSNATTFPEGSTINFSCKDGYLLQGVGSTTCRSGGWLGLMPKCEQITCGTLRIPPNGWMRGANSTAVGSKASFGCFQGYALMGSRDRECQENGEWSGSPVRCVPLALYTDRSSTSCLDPGTPDNGVRVGHSRFVIGREVEFACNPGYWLRGNATIRCLESGDWSAKPPLCIGKFYFDDERYVMEVLGDKFSRDIQFPQSQRNDHNKATDHCLTLNSPRTRHYVYFLFDASNSIGERNFRHAIDLAKAITRKMTVSESGSRIGAIVFAKEAEEVIRLWECTSTEEALDRLDNIKYKSGNGTSIRAAITRLEMSIHRVLAALRGIHKTVHFSAFLFTDGKANIGGRVDKLIIKNKQVETYCIGIRGNAHMENLKNLASKPTDTHLFVLRNTDALQRLAETLTTG